MRAELEASNTPDRGVAREASRPRVLCCVNHYYGPHPAFGGNSTTQDREVRRGIVTRTLRALRSLDADVEVRVCGVPGRALVPLDETFELEDARWLVFESLARMSKEVERFDYFVNIEDDVELPPRTFRNILAFDGEAAVNECLHPNRLEYRDGLARCVDLEAVPGWTLQERSFGAETLRTALNPHSGLLVLSRRKLSYALQHVDPAFRGTVVGGPMASAYAHWHKPFVLWRTSALEAHAVTHLDAWEPWEPPPQHATERNFTAVLLSWRRVHNLPVIVGALSRIPEIGEILVWNNDPDRSLDLPRATVVNAPANFGCLARYCLVPLARHDDIWFQDDDVVVTPGQFHALLERYLADPTRIVGCRGRNLRDGRYVFEDAYGEVDVVLGQTMMFHRGLLAHAFAALGELPPPREDDIAFSLSCGRKHLAVDVEPLRDLGMSDEVALHRQPGHAERRQAAVDRWLGWRARRPAGPVGEAGLDADPQLLRARLELLRSEYDALAARHEALRGSAGVRAIDALKRVPHLHATYMRLKSVLRQGRP